jgi:hypothetical protein
VKGLHEGKAARLLAQAFVSPDRAPGSAVGETWSNFVFLLVVFNNAGCFDASILEFAAASTVFTGISLDEREKPSKSRRRWTV